MVYIDVCTVDLGLHLSCVFMCMVSQHAVIIQYGSLYKSKM